MKFLIVLAACIMACYAADVEILRSDSDISPDGSYHYSYEASNGIAAEEAGALKDPETIAAQGKFSYTSPEGENVQISYVADENGFQPTGSHIPVGPEIPEAIVRALAWNAAHPEKE